MCVNRFHFEKYELFHHWCNIFKYYFSYKAIQNSSISDLWRHGLDTLIELQYENNNNIQRNEPLNRESAFQRHEF
jgi:hypothetical protein